MSSVTLRTSKKINSRATRKQKQISPTYVSSLKAKQPNIFATFKIQYKIWIFIPVYNFGNFLQACFKSLKTQTYKNFTVLIIDDGSTDNSSSIIAQWLKQFPSVKLLTNTSNKGGGHTKWQAIEYVRKKAQKNDIFTILDGDDSYKQTTALELIVNTYLTKKCWVTHGSADGKFSKHTNTQMPINIATLRSDPQFNFQHPRTSLCFLLDYVKKEDFQDEKKSWLQRVTDRLFIYKLIELTGKDRVYNIKENIYFYREHADNVRNKVSATYKDTVIDYIKTTIPVKPIEEKINIVMCCYRRHENLKEIIKSVDNQTVANRIVFHIVNTNPDTTKWNYLKTLIKTPGLFVNISIKLCNTKQNLFGYARFLYSKKLLKTTALPYVIFIDDDQQLHSNWVEKMWKTRAPLCYNTWFGRVFNKSEKISDYNYWDSESTYSSIHTNNYNPLTQHGQFHYGGTGGSVIDTNIFRFDITFRCPTEYRNIEDLWLSYVVRQVIGGKINNIHNPIKQHTFENEQKTALWKNVGDRKSDFLKELMQCGYITTNGYNKTNLDNLLEAKNDSEKTIAMFETQ